MATITCCMIVKNEEEILEKCIEHVKNIVDNFVIVDTGSTDKTKEIIKKYGTVYELPFEDFVTTKNKALEFVTGDYVLWMDADEILYEGADLLKIHADESQYDAVFSRITEGPEDYSIIGMQYDRVRMWKNGTFKFAGPGVHEVAVGEGKTIKDIRVSVRHEHLKSDKAVTGRERFEKYITLLKNSIEQENELYRAWFYLGRTYKDLGNFTEAIDAYIQYLNLPDLTFRDEIWQAHYDISQCYKVLGEYEKASSWAIKAITVDNRRSEAFCLIGDLHFQRQEYDKAIICYQQAIHDIPNDVILFLSPTFYSHYPKDQLILCHYYSGEFDDADYVCKYLINETNGREDRIINNLWWITKKVKATIFMTLGYTPEPVYGGMINDVGVGGVETTYLELSEELARTGKNVFLFCNTSEAHIYKGVYYVPWEQINEYYKLDPDVIITSRWFDPFYEDTKAKKIIWFQDAFFGVPDDKPDLFSKADKVICSSEWHKNYICERLGRSISPNKLQVIPLGIRKDLFVQGINKDPNKMIYSSNPDRGLEQLIDMWDRITEKYPNINLTVTYGWEGLKTWSGDSSWHNSIKQLQEKCFKKAEECGNIRFTGRVTKKELAKELLSSSIMLYPNNFNETFCCHPDNLIFTNSGFKKITEVTMNDKLLTHCNRFRNINKILSRNFDGDLIGVELKNSKGDIPYFTPEHPVLCMKKEEVKKIKGVKYFGYSPTHLEIEPKWRSIKEIEEDDFIAYSFPENNNNYKHEKYYFINDLVKVNRNYKVCEDGRIRAHNRKDQFGCPEYVKIDEGFARFLGLYFAEGSYSQSRITISLHAKEQEYNDFITDYVDKKLGFNYKVTVSGNQRRIDISNYIFGRWLVSKIGHSAAYKNIPDFMYKQPKKIKEAFIKGIFEGDAHFYSNGIIMTLATKIGIMNLKMLMNQIGYFPTFSKVNTVRAKGLNNSYYNLLLSKSQCEILFNDERNTQLNKNYFEHNGKIYYKVSKLLIQKYTGRVYNFEVEEDNSYVSGFLTVHNCLTSLETQAAGTPMITTNMGALSTVVNNKCNYLIDGSPRTEAYQNIFINCLSDLMDNPDKLKTFSDENRRTVLESPCDWEDINKLWIKVIYSLLKEE